MFMTADEVRAYREDCKRRGIDPFPWQKRPTKRLNRFHKHAAHMENHQARAETNRQRSNSPSRNPTWSAPTGPAAPHKPKFKRD